MLFYAYHILLPHNAGPFSAYDLVVNIRLYDYAINLLYPTDPEEMRRTQEAMGNQGGLASLLPGAAGRS